MEEPSFISNSDLSTGAERSARSGVLLTVIVLIACFLLCEIALRVTGWPREVPYELGGEEYNAVAGVLNRNEVPEVMVVGSSRAREAISLPMLKELLTARAGRPVSVGSFAVSGAQMSDVDAIVSRTLRTDNPPKIILYGIAERDINRVSPIFDQATRYWDFQDWRNASEIAGLGKTVPELATVVRSEIGRYLRIVGEREQIRLTVRQRLNGSFLNAKDTLIYGQPTDWQKNSPRRNLVNRPARKDQVNQNIRNFQRHEYPDPALLACFRQMLERFEGSRTQLILFEVPPARIIRRSLPKEIYPTFLETVKSLSDDKPNVKFLSTEQLGVYLNDRDFREMAHLNLTGAAKVTQALTDAIYPPKKRKRPATTSAPATTPTE